MPKHPSGLGGVCGGVALEVQKEAKSKTLYVL